MFVFLCLGTWLGYSLKGNYKEEGDLDAQAKACSLLRQLIDSLLAHLFCSSLNDANKNTYQNLGRAMSLPGIRHLMNRYISGKDYNERRANRESLKMKKTNVVVRKRVKGHWTSFEEVESYVANMDENLKVWRGRIRESEYDSGGLLLIYSIDMLIYYLFVSMQSTLSWRLS